MKVGFEIHIQLNTTEKLFCSCSPQASDTGFFTFYRRLRASPSELGEVDPAAAFEMEKGQKITYVAGNKTSCLVEADEEPPHEPNPEAIKSAIKIANIFGSVIVDEIHFMRKIVVDGSNPSGFQRTAIVGLGGSFTHRGKSVGLTTICLEEDAARLEKKEKEGPVYSLDRQGVPLLEITTEPLELSPGDAESLARNIGRTLKLTGLFARGLGTIRQDVNLSMEGHGVVEVKGVQKLEQIKKVMEFEEKRQGWLIEVAKRLRERGITEEEIDSLSPVDVTDELLRSSSGKVRDLVNRGRAFGVRAPGFESLIGSEPIPDARLGLDLADLCRLFGIGGIIHSDEIGKYGLESDIISSLRSKLGLKESDGFLIAIAGEDQFARCFPYLKERLKAALSGPIAETRAATAKGTTRFMRPRPGASRMYPETDVPTIMISSKMKEEYRLSIKSWDEMVNDYAKRYSLPRQLAEQVLDSDFAGWFDEVLQKHKVQPSVVASLVAQVLSSLENQQAINLGEFERLIDAWEKGLVSKEAVIDIARQMAEKGMGFDQAVGSLNVKPLSVEELRSIIKEKLEELKGEGFSEGRLYGALMGRVMEVARGRIDGKVVNEEVKKAIEEAKRSQS